MRKHNQYYSRKKHEILQLSVANPNHLIRSFHYSLHNYTDFTKISKFKKKKKQRTLEKENLTRDLRFQIPI